jgi:hypothetical protein
MNHNCELQGEIIMKASGRSLGCQLARFIVETNQRFAGVHARLDSMQPLTTFDEEMEESECHDDGGEREEEDGARERFGF